MVGLTLFCGNCTLLIPKRSCESVKELLKGEAKMQEERFGVEDRCFNEDKSISV